jgi:uncharacterized protein (UPF0335 family)
MNCKSHIQPRFSQNQVAPLVERIEQLEAEVKRLRQREAERQQEKG